MDLVVSDRKPKTSILKQDRNLFLTYIKVGTGLIWSFMLHGITDLLPINPFLFLALHPLLGYKPYSY